MKSETWTLIEEKFKRHPALKAEAVPYEEIDAAATVAGITFPQDYREFIHRYGGAILGPLPIIGLRKSQAMADTEGSVIEITKYFRSQGWRGVNEWLGREFKIEKIEHEGVWSRLLRCISA